MIYSFDNWEGNDKCYRGNAGSKKGIIFNGEDWFIKLPQSTRGNRTREVSYTSSPLSE